MRAFPALITASLVALAGCGFAADAERGAEGEPVAGRSDQRSYRVGPFDSVSLGGHHNVIVRVGPAVSVRAEGPAEELDRLKIEVDDGDLEIGTRREFANLRGRRQPVTVYVTLPRLTAAAIGGSGRMRIDRVEGGDFSASIGGSGDMEVASLRVEEAEFSIAGSGGLAAAGSARSQDISIAGSGDLDLSKFESRTASVSIAGSGGVRTRATQSADVSIIGSGDVEIGGGAKCSVSKMGSGSVRCTG